MQPMSGFSVDSRPDLDRTAVGLPKQVVLFRFTHPWMIARHRNQCRQPSRHLRR
jgi:hypothetical protein